MGGTVAGGLKARDTNLALHGKDFYKNIGRKGGLVPTPTGGFGSNKVGEDGLTGRERAHVVGAKGGKKSKRGPAKKKKETTNDGV